MHQGFGDAIGLNSGVSYTYNTVYDLGVDRSGTAPQKGGRKD